MLSGWWGSGSGVFRGGGRGQRGQTGLSHADGREIRNQQVGLKFFFLFFLIFQEEKKKEKLSNLTQYKSFSFLIFSY